MAELKTKQTDKSIESYLKGISDENKRNDALSLIEMFKDITSSEPAIWGDGIIGFGNFHFKYASGREVDWFKTGFSVRKDKFTIYLMIANLEKYSGLTLKLGKFKASKSCIYIKSLKDIDISVLKEIVIAALKDISSFGQ